jgi:hypothetical protein
MPGLFHARINRPSFRGALGANPESGAARWISGFVVIVSRFARPVDDAPE